MVAHQLGGTRQRLVRKDDVGSPNRLLREGIQKIWGPGRHKAGDNTLHESALGYLLTGGEALPSDLVMERWAHTCKGCAAISIVDATTAPSISSPIW